MQKTGLIIILLSFICCYSFKGISIDPEIKTFTVSEVSDPGFLSPGSYPVDFLEALNDKIRKDSRLILNSTNPDLEFICKISRFEVNSQAPQPGIESAINRCTIEIEVELTNHKDEKQNWKSKFSHYQDFDSNVNFSDIQEQLTTEINKLLVEDIFNKSFSNW